MRIVLNTRTEIENVGSRVWIHNLQQRLSEHGIAATLNDWEHYDRYDVAVFLGYDYDVENARKQNPNIRIAIADPKQSRPEWIEIARQADFLMVSSVEQRDFFLRLNNDIMIYYCLPTMPAIEKIHVDKRPIIIGYHGNLAHIACMHGGLQLALNELAKSYDLEFWAIYNIANLGKAEFGMPDENLMKIRHIQWTWQNYYDELAHVDIGIVPNEIPIKDKQHILKLGAYAQQQIRSKPFDHLLRLKVSCNPARMYPFAQLGIPVVADFAPSASQFIYDGESGFIVSSPNGWYQALEMMINSAKLRNKMAHNLHRCMKVAYDKQIELFLEFCRKDLIKTQPIQFEGYPTVEEQLAQVPHYLPQKPKPWGYKTKKRLWKLLKNFSYSGVQ